MKNISANRLLAVLMLAAFFASGSEIKAVFEVKLPPNPTFGMIIERVEEALVRSFNAIIPAMMSALMGFFIRADKHAPLWVTKAGDK